MLPCFITWKTDSLILLFEGEFSIKVSFLILGKVDLKT